MMLETNNLFQDLFMLNELHREAIRREVQGNRLARQAHTPAQQRRHFFLMYRVRNILFRISGTLAHKLVM